MPKPTLKALRKQPKAVILLAFDKNKVGEDPEWDFEWFETAKPMKDYFDEATAWNAQDYTDHGDLFHFAAEVTDTSNDLTLGRVHIIPSDNEELIAFRDKVTADHSLLIAPAPKRGTVTTAKKVTKPKVKGRGQSAAAKALKGDDAAEEPKTPAKKKPVKKKVVAKSGPRGVPQGTGRAKDLKARLAAKKAAESKAAEPKTEVKAEVKEAAPATTE